jgi:DNA transposition AAA+ family ATPase
MAAMATSRAQRTAALALDLPASAIVRRQLKDYLGRSGMSPAEFGERIDYSYPAVQNFIYDTYGKISGSDLAIRRAIVEFIEAHPLAAMTMADGKLYETENVRLLRKYFYAALDRGYAYYVDGGPGSQKTFVLQHLIAELNRKEIAKNGAGKRAYYVRCRPKISPTQLLRRICQACGVSGTGDVERMIRALRHEFAKRRVALAVDEAQHLEKALDALETIRELVDEPPHFGLVLAGSHGLRDMFERRALVLEQWNSRLHAGKSLPGIQRDEATEIIRGELGAIAKDKADKLIKDATTRDLRAGAEHTYISARRLFWSLRAIREQMEERAAKGATA